MRSIYEIFKGFGKKKKIELDVIIPSVENVNNKIVKGDINE